MARDVDEWLELWLRTQLLVHVEGRWVDLDVDAPPPGLPFPICLVTARNPRAEERSTEENEQANAALEAELVRSAAPFLPALGRARDGSWQEPGFAVSGLDEQEAQELGRRYGQLAVFWVTEDDVLVLGALADVRTPRECGRDEVIEP